MGMAASQARYLALTARKTNTEYEGQQINQARTALANQSANLFNRLLGLEVPVAPKTTDFTELQYSYTDGENESVLESWYQLSTSDSDYNYIVNHYYNTQVYTGAEKLLENPQIQKKGTLSIDNFLGQNPVVTYNVNTDSYTITTANGQSKTYSALSGMQMDTRLENALRHFEETQNIIPRNGNLTTNSVYGYQDNSETWHFFLDYEIAAPKDYSTIYVPDYVGNCKLTELQSLTQDEATELAQIIKDCPNSKITQYLSFDNNGNLVYNGNGVYTYQMNGTKYFTSEADLLHSMQTHDNYERPIEDQEKLAFYKASYVEKRIEETNKALLETDDNGRFVSVKFDNNSVVYALNTETVTDEAAYQDAMNEYNYKVQQYEKTIADINAKTSIIQEEDRTLELRLKQLDTEQNALATEMEAVKKIIKENVEKTFKTFSD